MTQNRYGTITMTGTRDVTLNALNIEDTGFHAIYMLFANTGDVVENSEIGNVGANGIDYSPRYGVGWAAWPNLPVADDYIYGEKLSYLKIDHTGLDSGDEGAIYANEADNQQSSVSQVTIDDVQADPSMPDVPPSGINMDFGTCGITFANVQVTNAEKTQFNSGDNSCYPTTNVTWTGTFDPVQMQYRQIGVLESFPYPVSSS